MFDKVKRFFSLKKYSIIRFCIVLGCLVWGLIIWTDEYSSLSNWGDYVVFPFIGIFIGLLLYGLSFTLADAFCKDKTIGLCEKYLNDDFNKYDLKEIAEILHKEEKITKDLYLIICYFLEKEPYYGKLYVSQGENFPPYNALQKENETKRIQFLKNFKMFIEKLKNETKK